MIRDGNMLKHESIGQNRDYIFYASFEEYFTNLMGGRLNKEAAYEYKVTLANQLKEELGYSDKDIPMYTERHVETTGTSKGNTMWQDAVYKRIQVSVKGFAYGEILGMYNQRYEEGYILFGHPHNTKNHQGYILFPKEFFGNIPINENMILPYPMLGARINEAIYENISGLYKNTQESIQFYSFFNVDYRRTFFEMFGQNIYEKIVSKVNSENINRYSVCCPYTRWIYGKHEQEQTRHFNTMQYMFPLAAYISQVAVLAFDKYGVENYLGVDGTHSNYGYNLFLISVVMGKGLSETITPVFDDNDTIALQISAISGLFCGILVFLAMPNYQLDSSNYKGNVDSRTSIDNLKKIVENFSDFVNKKPNEVVFIRVLDIMKNALYRVKPIYKFEEKCFGKFEKTEDTDQVCIETIYSVFELLINIIVDITNDVNDLTSDQLMNRIQNEKFKDVGVFLMSMVGGLIGLIKGQDFEILDRQYNAIHNKYKDLSTYDLTKDIFSEFKDLNSRIEKSFIKDDHITTKISGVSEESLKIQQNVIGYNEAARDFDNINKLLTGFNSGLIYGDFSKNGMGNLIWHYIKTVYNEQLDPYIKSLSSTGINLWVDDRKYNDFEFYTPSNEPTLIFKQISSYFNHKIDFGDDNQYNFYPFIFYRPDSSEQDLSNHNTTDIITGDATVFLLQILVNYSHEENANLFNNNNYLIGLMRQFYKDRTKIIDHLYIPIFSNGGSNVNFYVPYNVYLQEMTDKCHVFQENVPCERTELFLNYGYNIAHDVFNTLRININDIEPRDQFHELSKHKESLDIYKKVLSKIEVKIDSFSQIYFIIPIMNYCIIHECLMAATKDNISFHLTNVIKDPLKHSLTCLPKLSKSLYVFEIFQSLMELYSFLLYMIKTRVFEGVSKININEYTKIAKFNHNSEFIFGLNLDNNSDRNNKMIVGTSRWIDTIDHTSNKKIYIDFTGKVEMYIIGCFIHDISNVEPYGGSEHDIFMKYMVEYTGSFRGILGPILGAIYGIFKTSNSDFDYWKLVTDIKADRFNRYKVTLNTHFDINNDPINSDKQYNILSKLTNDIIKSNSIIIKSGSEMEMEMEIE
jgi:hypothetical protein